MNEQPEPADESVVLFLKGLPGRTTVPGFHLWRMTAQAARLLYVFDAQVTFADTALRDCAAREVMRSVRRDEEGLVIVRLPAGFDTRAFRESTQQQLLPPDRARFDQEGDRRLRVLSADGDLLQALRAIPANVPVVALDGAAGDQWAAFSEQKGSEGLSQEREARRLIDAPHDPQRARRAWISFWPESRWRALDAASRLGVASTFDAFSISDRWNAWRAVAADELVTHSATVLDPGVARALRCRPGGVLRLRRTVPARQRPTAFLDLSGASISQPPAAAMGGAPSEEATFEELEALAAQRPSSERITADLFPGRTIPVVVRRWEHENGVALVFLEGRFRLLGFEGAVKRRGDDEEDQSIAVDVRRERSWVRLAAEGTEDVVLVCEPGGAVSWGSAPVTDPGVERPGGEGAKD